MSSHRSPRHCGVWAAVRPTAVLVRKGRAPGRGRRPTPNGEFLDAIVLYVNLEFLVPMPVPQPGCYTAVPVRYGNLSIDCQLAIYLGRLPVLGTLRKIPGGRLNGQI